MAQQRVRDILLRIRGDSSDAEQDLHDLARELTKFDGTVAEAKVDIDATPAQRKIDAAKKAVQDFGRLTEQAKIDLQDQAARVKLDRLRTNLENLQKKPVSPKVDIAIGATVAKIERVEAQLDKLDRRRVDIDVDVDRGGVGRGLAAGIAGIGAGLTAATQGLGLFVSAASTGLPIIGGVGRLLLQLGISGAALGPVFLVLIPIMIAAAAAVALLGGAVVALGASFLAAAAGVGVLGVALAAAFGPVLLVAIAAMARFAKVLEAVKGSEDGAAQGAERVADAQRNAAAAADRVKATAVDAYREWARAAEETRDAICGIAQAELSRDQARLNVKQAEQNLKELRAEAGLTGTAFDGLFKKFSDVNADTRGLAGAIKAAGGRALGGATALDIEQGVLDLQQARLSERDAIDGVGDVHTRLEDARAREQEFIQNGIKAYEPYTAALEASAAATAALADARTQQAEATKDLTPQEKRLVDVLKDLKETLTKLFEPATRAIFEGLLDLLEDIADFAKDQGVRRGFREIGAAIGGLFRGIGREIRRKEFRDAFKTFAEGGAAIIRTLTPIFRTMFRTITRLAEIALPWLLEEIRGIGRAFRRWAGDLDRSKIKDFVDGVRESFGKWKRIALELWGIVVAFFHGAKGSGDDLADTIGDILEEMRIWLEQNPDKVKNFFRDAAAFASAMASALEKVVAAVKFINENPVVISPAAAAAGSGAFSGILDFFTGNFKLPGTRRQLGGVIPGPGTGDIVPAMLEPGEFVIRRSVAQAIGIPRLNLLNAGATPRGMSRGGVVIQQQDVHLPAAPGHGQLGDARHQAVMFAREMARRGGTPVTR